MSESWLSVNFDKILQSKSYTIIVLSHPEKRFAIYADPSCGAILQRAASGAKTTRPLTHDLIHLLFEGMDIRVKQVVINELQDNIYFSRIFLEQTQKELSYLNEIDARPSDALTLALLHHAPIFCHRSVLEKAVAFQD